MQLTRNGTIPTNRTGTGVSLAASAGPSTSPADLETQLQALYREATRFFESRGLNYMQAEDLALEACLRWLMQVKRGRKVDQGWICTVQRHLLIDHLRFRDCEHRLLESYTRETEFYHDYRWTGEIPPQLADAWEHLADSDQTILFRHYMEGQTVQELAQRMEISADCAKQRLCRARARLIQLQSEPHDSFP